MENGLYLTNADFKQFQDHFSELYNAQNKLNGISSKPSENVLTQDITFVVTEACNLCCTYCYETHKTNKVMTKETAKQAVDAILDDNWTNGYYNSKNKPGLILEFIGGEPFLNIEVIDFATEYFKYKANKLNHPWAKNYMISISTNGTLYFDKAVQDYIQKNHSHLSLGITIDGNKKLHDKCRLFPDGRGSYDIVEKAIKDYNARFCHERSTKVTLAPENVEYLVEALKDLFELGFECAYTNCCYEEGWTIENAKVFYDQLKLLADYLLEDKRYTRHYCTLFDEKIGDKLKDTKNWCGGNGEMLAIGTDGACYPCIRFMDYSLNNGRKGTPIGHIKTSLDNPKKNCFLCQLRKIDMITQCQFEDNKKCLDCPIASGCALCTGFNYDYFGDPNHKATFICDMHRARVLANVYFWNKLYREVGLSKRFECHLDEETALRIIDKKEYDFLNSLVKGGE